MDNKTQRNVTQKEKYQNKVLNNSLQKVQPRSLQTRVKATINEQKTRLINLFV